MPSPSAEPEKRILLPPTNDIRTGDQLKDRLARCLRDSRTLVLDAVDFQSGDIIFVQTLISAAKTAAGLGGRMEIANAPPAFAALLERCGFDARPPALVPANNEDVP